MKSILVIDDEDIIRIALKRILEKNGYQVITLKDGVDVTKVCREENICLIITDIIMPNKDGMEVIREMKKYFPNIKIIAISGGGRTKNMNFLEYSKEFGVDATIEKPFEADVILTKISDLLSNDIEIKLDGFNV